MVNEESFGFDNILSVFKVNLIAHQLHLFRNSNKLFAILIQGKSYHDDNKFLFIFGMSFK